MATVDGNEATWNLGGTDEPDVFKFKEGHGNDRIIAFDPGRDVIDLSGFDQNISWQELQDCIRFERGYAWGKYYTNMYVDLTKWGGGEILANLTTSDKPEDVARMFKLPALVGTDESDSLVGSPGDDVLEGGGGGDTVSGGAGDDVIIGGAGDDFLEGGRLTKVGDKGTGNDTFVFAPGHGNDAIADFNSGEDKIDLSAFTRVNGFSDLTITQAGDEVLIDLSKHGGGSIVLGYTDLDDLDASDFIFHDDDAM